MRWSGAAGAVCLQSCLDDECSRGADLRGGAVEASGGDCAGGGISALTPFTVPKTAVDWLDVSITFVTVSVN